MPLSIRSADLMLELRTTLVEINKTIEGLKKDIEKKISVLPYPDNVTVYDWQSRDGMPMLAPLLATKAQVLQAIVALQTEERKK